MFTRYLCTLVRVKTQNEQNNLREGFILAHSGRISVHDNSEELGGSNSHHGIQNAESGGWRQRGWLY